MQNSNTNRRVMSIVQVGQVRKLEKSGARFSDKQNERTKRKIDEGENKDSRRVKKARLAAFRAEYHRACQGYVVERGRISVPALSGWIYKSSISNFVNEK